MRSSHFSDMRPLAVNGSSSSIGSSTLPEGTGTEVLDPKRVETAAEMPDTDMGE